jgi:predicted Fe-S protein YdhL (DUF1289 family)
MRIGLPFDALHEAIAAATHRDFSEITYEDRDWDAYRGMTALAQLAAVRNNTVPMVTKTRRPFSDELEIIMFPQNWGSTATGYGGIGGSAMTGAYTIIVSYMMTTYCVYFGCGRLAYKLNWADMTPSGRDNFLSDMAARNMASVAKSEKYR